MFQGLKLSFILFVCFTVSSFALYDFKDADANKIAKTVSEILSDLKNKQRPQNLGQLKKDIQDLDRGRLDGEALVELKYMLSVFKATVVQERIKSLENAGDEKLDEILSDLEVLGGYLSVAQSEAVLKAVEGKQSLEEKAYLVIAKFGDPKGTREAVKNSGFKKANSLAGPETLLEYEGASFSKKYESAKWLGTKGLDLSAYFATSNYSAIVRGVEVRSGDVFVMDHGLAGGVNTNFSIPRSYATHTGMVVFLEYKEKIYPAFFEICEKGLRVVPLNTALSAPFATYGEVYRPSNIPAKLESEEYILWAKALSADVFKRMAEKHYYSYFNPKIVNGDELDVVCSSQVQLCLLRQGLKLKLPVDTIHPKAIKSLATQFDFKLEEYVTPSAYVRAGKSQLAFVGAFESGFLNQNIVRELVIGAPNEEAPESLGYLFSQKSLNVSLINPPDMKQKYQLFQVAFKIMSDSEIVLVKAPPSLIAFAKLIDIPLKITVRQFDSNFEKEIYSFDSFDTFSIHEKATSPQFKKLLKERMALLASWFE